MANPQGSGFRVLILGHGAMGRSMERLLQPRHRLRIWDRDLESGRETEPLETAGRNCDAVIFALPAKPHAELATRLAPVLPANAVSLTIAKGLDDSGATPAEVLARCLGPRNLAWAVCYGPMIARELQAGQAGFGLLAGSDQQAVAFARQLFAGSPLYLAASDDVLGASWAVILKNVYVPVLGAADALQLGDNVRGFLYARALGEIAALVTHLGGRAETVYGLPGLADLVTSASSTSSHHRQIGADLAAGRIDRMAAAGVNIRGEGIHTVELLAARRPELLRHLPLARLLLRMLDAPEQTGNLVRDYLSGELR